MLIMFWKICFVCVHYRLSNSCMYVTISLLLPSKAKHSYLDTFILKYLYSKYDIVLFLCQQDLGTLSVGENDKYYILN